MKIGYNETMPKNGLAEDLEMCIKYNYDLIEVRIEYLQDYLETHPIGELKTFFATHDLKPLAFNSVDEVNFCTEEEWAAIMRRFIFCCQMSKELDIPYIVVCPTGNEEMKNKTEQEVFDDSVKVLRELADMAKIFGAKIAFEPIGTRLWCVNSIKQAWEIVQAVDRDNVGLTIDIFNLYAYNGFEDLDDLREVPVDKIYVFHINDSKDLPVEEMDPHFHRLQPGDGILPIKKFVKVLKEMGYDGNVSLELFGPHFEEDMDPETVIREGYEKTKAILDAVE